MDVGKTSLLDQSLILYTIEVHDMTTLGLFNFVRIDLSLHFQNLEEDIQFLILLSFCKGAEGAISLANTDSKHIDCKPNER